MNPTRLRWPIILITVMVIWIVVITVLIYRGPRLPHGSARAGPSPAAVAPQTPPKTIALAMHYQR